MKSRPEHSGSTLLGAFKFLNYGGESGTNMRDMPYPAIISFSGSGMTNGPQFNTATMVFGFFFKGYGDQRTAILFGNTSPEIFVCPDYRECTSSSWNRIV